MKRFDLAIAGELNLDLILYGLPEALPLERELLASGACLTLGSSSAIVAHNAARLGLTVGFATKVAADPMGTIALERLAESGVNLDRVVYARGEESTGVTVLLTHEHGRNILTYPGTMASMTLKELDLEYLASARHFHLSSVFLQTELRRGMATLLRFLRQNGVTVSLDTNDDPADKWDGVVSDLLPWVNVLLPNEREACRIAGQTNLSDALAFLSRHVPVVVAKCGREGAIVQAGSERWNVPAVTVTPVDTIGAGDSFNAGFLAAYLKGADLPACARAGTITGALSTLRAGGTEAFRDQSLSQTFLTEHRFGDGE